jgi:hypothetical protein
MPAFGLVLAEGAANIHYQFARVQALSEWWHWLILLALVAAIAGYVVWMYRRDSVELPRGLAVLLIGLRLLAFIGILVFFFGLEKRTERTLVKNSRVQVLVDSSQSMGLRDADASNVPAAASRIEQVAQEFAQGKLLDTLRDKHDVIVSRFDEGEAPVEVAAYPRKPQKPAAGETDDGSEQSREDRLGQLLREARWTAGIAGGVLLISLVAGAFFLARGGRVSAKETGEATSWSLLVAMTTAIAAAVILAVATLRAPEISPLTIAGLAPLPTVEEASGGTDDEAAKAEIPEVDWQAELTPRGGKTRIGDNLQAVVDRERGGPIAGVVMLSDGGETEGNDGAQAAQAAQDALIPFYMVGLGSDKRPANLRVVDVEAPERVYPGDKFTLTGYLQSEGNSRTSFSVELLSSEEDGQNELKEDERTVDLGRDGKVVPIKFEITPELEGIRQFKLRMKPLTGEIDVRDNEKSAKVEVIDRKTRVLLIAGGPMRDYQFLRNQLYRDPEIVSDVWLQSGRPGISQESNELLFKFPESEDELFEYDAIVAFDADWEQLDESQVALLERWVAEKAGGLIVVAGPVHTPQWSSRRRGDPRIDTLKSLYPVVFYFQGAATLSLGRFGSEKAWPLQFTRDGQQAEFLWLEDDSLASEQAWQSFDGVSGYYAVKDPKPGAKIYTRFSDPETSIDGELPIYMASQFYGSGRVLFMASGEMWRINEVDDTYSQKFYTKLIRWVAEGRLLRDSSRGLLLVDKDRCSLGDQVSIRAMLQDAQHMPLTLDQVEGVLIRPDSTRQSLTLKKVKDDAREGTYTDQFIALQEGDYRIELQNPAAGDELLVREVRAMIPAAETERPERNDLLLRDLADTTEGEYFIGLESALGRDGTGRAALATIIKPQDQRTVLPGTPDRKFEQLLMGWLMGLICGVLCLEWLIRRLSKLA